MRRVEISHLQRAFTAPEREALVEVLIVIAPTPTTAPNAIQALFTEVVTVLTRHWRESSMTSHPQFGWTTVAPPAPGTFPSFLLTWGATYLDTTGIYEAIDRLRAGTPREEIINGSAGRAFEVTVWCSFRRVPGRTAPCQRPGVLSAPPRPGSTAAEGQKRCGRHK